MNYAPILLPTLCRYEPLVRCIDSLRRNAWADRTDLVIALDYPKKASHREGYEKIRRYLEETRFPEFRGVQVILRKKNYGAIRNFRDLLDIGFAKYDRCICVFDDLTFSPNFIQYMDEMLERFEGEPDVEAVLGYSYPVAWKAVEGSNAILQNFSGSIWGIGFWREKFLEMSRYLEGGGLVRDDRNGGRFVNRPCGDEGTFVPFVGEGLAPPARLVCCRRWVYPLRFREQ